jgi:ABC-type antimicrobial peptide transport system permease subunit
MVYHLKIFLRNLYRNFTYSGINIAGLAIGITASIFIFLWVYHERTFDRCYPDTKRIYRIINTDKQDNERLESRTVASVSLPFIRECESGIPEIETVAMNLGGLIETVKVNHDIFSLKSGDAVTVNRAWLEMFNGGLLDGSFDEYDNHPFSVALTASAANKYFGDSRPIGQIVRINNADYKVQAVVKDNPSNSSFRYHLMISTGAVFSNESMQYMNRWVVDWARTFVKLRPDADVAQVTQKMNDIYANNDLNKEVRLELLTDMYFSDVKGTVNGNAQMVSIFGLLGVLLLSVACINYINLTTARVTHRIKEVSLKKIVGAKRRMLFLQFIAESFILSFAATIIAVFLIRALTPLFQTLVGNIPINFSSPVVWTITGITLLFVTVLNGVYPAWILSSFHPVHSLKGMVSPNVKAGNLRRGLVVFQFSMSAALIICVIVIFMQTRYIQNYDPGFRKDHIVRISVPLGSLYKSDDPIFVLQSLKGEMQSCPSIISASSSMGNIENNRLDVTGGSGVMYFPFDPLSTDEDFIYVFELQLTEGRWFHAGEADNNNYVFNETAIRELQIEEPYIGQPFEFMGKGVIIGVVKDFHFRSLHEKIGSLVFCQKKQFNSTLNIKIQEGKSIEAVEEIKAVWSKFFPDDAFDYTFVDDAIANLYRSDNFTSKMVLVFGILAGVIAVLGLFGLSTFAIERRTKEIGIRKVLGASIPNIVNLLTREFIILVAIAFIIASPVAWWAMSRWLENFAYHINIVVWIFVTGAVVILAITLAAVGIQTVKAATANPAKAIKME